MSSSPCQFDQQTSLGLVSRDYYACTGPYAEVSLHVYMYTNPHASAVQLKRFNQWIMKAVPTIHLSPWISCPSEFVPKNPQMMRLSAETSVHISAQINFIPTLRNVVSLYVMNENTHNADNSISIQTRCVSGTDVRCSGFTLQLPILP